MKLLKWIDEYFEKAFLIVCLSVMVLLIFMQIVLRWLGSATIWAEELARYIMLYLLWVAASYAVKRNEHIRLTVLVEKVTGKKRDKLELVVLGVWLMFALWLLVEGIFLVQKISAMHQVSAAMRIPMVIPYASAPVGGLLMSVRLVQKIIETLKKLGDDKNYETKEAA
jgi:C4-dicarboxylate transport system (permease small protein)